MVKEIVIHTITSGHQKFLSLRRHVHWNGETLTSFTQRIVTVSCLTLDADYELNCDSPPPSGWLLGHQKESFPEPNYRYEPNLSVAACTRGNTTISVVQIWATFHPSYLT